MKQNYNSPFFLLDATGVGAEDITTHFRTEFLKAYPTKAEAVIFAKHGGACIVYANGGGVDNYYFDSAKIISLREDSEQAALLFSVNSGEGEDLSVEVIYENTSGGDTPGGGMG